MEEPLARREIFSGRVVRLVLDTVQRSNGSEAQREVVLHPGGTVILAIADDGRIVLVEQYRHPAGATLWELPAGKLEPGEAPLACARRELLEETGYEAVSWTQRLSFFTSPGFTNERLILFEARGLTRTGMPRLGEIDHCALVSQGALLARVAEGKIVDAKTLLGVFLWASETVHR
jgi:ADP-ribose pyrophosphatase